MGNAWQCEAVIGPSSVKKSAPQVSTSLSLLVRSSGRMKDLELTFPAGQQQHACDGRKKPL